MPQVRLSDTLFNLHEIVPLDWKYAPLLPSTQVTFFLVKGHVMEYIDLGLPNKIVALFFGPNEFVVKCHPFSKIVGLDDTEVNNFTHGYIVNLLRKFPETHHHYRGIRKHYFEKVAARQRSLTTMSETARFDDMAKRQPWILELADKRDIASYLHITPDVLYELINRS